MRDIAETNGLVKGRLLPALRRLCIIGPPALRRWWRRTAGLLRRTLARIGQLLIFAAGGALLGYGILTQAPSKVMMGLVGLAACVLAARKLDIGIVAVLIISVSIIHEGSIPKPFTVGGMGFHLSEFLILYMLGVVLFRLGGNKEMNVFRSPMTAPLLLLCLSVILSMVVGYRYQAAETPGPPEFKIIYNAVRPMFSYLLFFVVAFGLRDRREVRVVIRMAIWIAVIVSILMIAQYFIGTEKSLFIGSSYTSYTRAMDDTTEADQVTRSTPPGLALVVTFFIVAMVLVAYQDIRGGGVMISTLSILGIGLILSFYRSFWLSAAIGTIVVCLIVEWRARLRLAFVAAVAVLLTVIGGVSLMSMAPGTAGANFQKTVAQRFNSLLNPKETLRSSSLQNRLHENRIALEKIREQPIFGIGAGSPIQYRLLKSQLTGGKRFQSIPWMHNSYLELWLVYGITGVLSFAWLSIVFLSRCILLFRRTKDPLWRALGASLFAAYLGFLLRSVTQMHIVHDHFQIVTVVVMWGIVEAIWRIEDDERAEIGREVHSYRRVAIPVGASTGCGRAEECS